MWEENRNESVIIIQAKAVLKEKGRTKAIRYLNDCGYPWHAAARTINGFCEV